MGILVLVVLWICAPHARAEKVEFFAEEITVPMGRAVMIPVRMDPAPTTDRKMPVTLEPYGMVESLGDLVFPAGQATAHLRVRPKKAGEAQLRAGDGVVTLRIGQSSSGTGQYQASWVTPGPNAVVWDTIHIGVDVERPHDLPLEAEAPSAVLVRLKDEQVLSPVQLHHERAPSHYRYVFELDTSEMEPGRNRLRFELKSSGGEMLLTLAGEINVMERPVVHTFRGECEDFVRDLRAQPEERNPPRPLEPQADEKASGGQFLPVNSGRPAWSLPVTIRRAGHYQMIMRVRGIYAGGAFPSMGIQREGENNRSTHGRMVCSDWHRVAVGHPVRLEEGEQILTVEFINDFYAQKLGDRNAHYDAYELAWVPESVRSVPATRDARISFQRLFHGEEATGPVPLNARVHYEGSAEGPPPRVELLVNGQMRALVHHTRPGFRVEPSWLQPGSNNLVLRAVLADGREIVSAPQTVVLPDGVATGPIIAAPLVFSARYPGWDKNFVELLRPQQQRGHEDNPEAAMFSNADVALVLPDRLSGRYEIHINARGDAFEGPPVLNLEFHHNGEAIPVSDIVVRSGNRDYHAATMDLPPGPKRLQISYRNDHYVQGRGDRNVWVRQIALKKPLRTRDISEPVVELLYPAPGARLHGVDVAIASVWAPAGLESVDLVVDGEPTGLGLRQQDGMGRTVIPILLRERQAGPMEIQIAATDSLGRTTISRTRTVEVTASPPQLPEKTARAMRLLNRVAYGPDDRELAVILLDGEEAWLRQRLCAVSHNGTEELLLETVTAQHGRDNEYDIVSRVLRQALITPNPVRMRSVLWSQNHFSTWIGKTGAAPKWEEHLRFTRAGPAPMGTLLGLSATSPAMLFYLDQQNSFVGRINENYAREILELHTVGVKGGYTQEDVTSLARLLTGWLMTSEAHLDARGGAQSDRVFRFDPVLNDPSPGRVMGLSLPEADEARRYERVQMILEALASHPSTASFVSHKLAAHYFRMPPPEPVVGELEHVFHRSNGDLAAMIAHLASTPHLFDPALPPRIATPLDYGIRISRVAGSTNTGTLREFLRLSGMGLFERSTPDGYPEQDSAYADSNALLQRWRYAKTLENQLVNIVPGSLQRPAADGERRQWAQRVVDYTAFRLTGGLLTETSNEAALSVFLAEGGNPRERVMRTAVFICQVPEVSMRW